MTCWRCARAIKNQVEDVKSLSRVLAFDTLWGAEALLRRFGTRVILKEWTALRILKHRVVTKGNGLASIEGVVNVSMRCSTLRAMLG